MNKKSDRQREAVDETNDLVRRIRAEVRFIAARRGVKQRDVWADIVAPVVKAEFDKCVSADARRGA